MDLQGDNEHSDVRRLFDIHTAEDPSYTLPSPNRMLVPPPHIHHITGSRRTFNLDGCFLPPDDIDLGFLSGLDYASLFETDAVAIPKWTYPMRRNFNEILPFLYLGPMSAARERDKLRENGITMILAIQHRNFFPSSMTRGPMRAAEELGIAKDTFEVSNNSDMIKIYPHAIRIINEHLRDFHHSNPQQIPKVLIFCESGNARSAAVVVAYLLQMFSGLDVISACQVLSLRRLCVSIEEDVKQTLLSYDGIIKARRATQTSQLTPPQNGSLSTTLEGSLASSTTHKRQLSFDEDEMQVDDDADRFGRRNYAPFLDHQHAA